MIVVVRSAVTGLDSSWVLCASTPKYHAADTHDTLPSHFNPTPGKQQVPIFQSLTSPN